MPKEYVDQVRNDWCHQCPVQRSCLISALQNDERFGIWGGYTPEERKRMREEKLETSDELVIPDITTALAHFDQGTLFELVVRLT
jgi:hypothetical protein